MQDKVLLIAGTPFSFFPRLLARANITVGMISNSTKRITATTSVSTTTTTTASGEWRNL